MLIAAHLAYEGRMPTTGEKQAIKTAVAKLALASRAIDEVVERRGGIAGDVISDEEP